MTPLRDDLMVQQQLPAGRDTSVGIWQHMVAVIMLNQTGRKLAWSQLLPPGHRTGSQRCYLVLGHGQCALQKAQKDDRGFLDLGRQRCYNAVWYR
jgi:hypothetical protein